MVRGVHQTPVGEKNGRLAPAKRTGKLLPAEPRGKAVERPEKESGRAVVYELRVCTHYRSAERSRAPHGRCGELCILAGETRRD